MSRNFHSFTGEDACGRWAITQNRKYLWDCHFYWLCNCSAIKEILEYDGCIPMICRWDQELLGHQFNVSHRNKRMMADADALTRRFGTLITTHCSIANVLRLRDQQHRPSAYKSSLFHTYAANVSCDTADTSSLELILVHPYNCPSNLDKINGQPNDIKLSDDNLLPDINPAIGEVNPTLLSSSPVLFLDSSYCNPIDNHHKGAKMKITAM